MHVFYEKKDEKFSCSSVTNMNFPLHFHDSTELLYVHSGCIEVMIDDQTRQLNRGDLALVYPNMVHSYHTEGQSEIVLTIFQPSCAKDYSISFKNYYPVSPYLSGDDLHADCLLCFERMLHYTKNSESLCIAWLNLLLAYAVPQLTVQKRERTDRLGISHQLIQYLYEHFTESISLDSIARELHFNKSYISRVFSNRLGCGFYDYINQLRLDYVLFLLKDDEKSLTDIWHSAGFTSQKTFNRVFKDKYALTPTQYRQKYLDKQIISQTSKSPAYRK